MADVLTSLCRPSVPAMGPSSPLGLFVLLFVTWQASGVGSACPRDVSVQAHTCFSAYSREFQTVQSSPQPLCCGVDVETLRAYCSSYNDAMLCINGLKKRCPRSAAIQESMENLHGAGPALEDLCSDDRLIEVYARHQSCMTRAGSRTKQCLQRYLNTTDTVRLLADIHTRHIATFCRDMRGTLQCIQSNVRRMCGDEASDLAAKLVKPMVRQSSQCDYTVVTKAPNSRQAQPKLSSQDGSQRGPASGSGGGPEVSSASAILCVALVMRTWLQAS